MGGKNRCFPTNPWLGKITEWYNLRGHGAINWHPPYLLRTLRVWFSQLSVWTREKRAATAIHHYSVNSGAKISTKTRNKDPCSHWAVRDTGDGTQHPNLGLCRKIREGWQPYKFIFKYQCSCQWNRHNFSWASHLFSVPLWFTPKNDTRKIFSFIFSLPEHRKGRMVRCVGRTVQVAKRPEGETSRGQTGKVAKSPDTVVH